MHRFATICAPMGFCVLALGVIGASARIGAAFVGPMIATTTLAWTLPTLLYLVVAAIGVACLPLVMIGYQEAVA